jgi:hypothetical protein
MRKLFGNLLLVIGASIGTLLMLELVLQFVYPSHGTWRLYSIPDPELGWVLQPDAEFTRQVPGAFVNIRYNREGFRDSEHSDPPPDTATSIVILGDSYMEANMVPLQQVFHKQLERLAAVQGRQIASYNLGVAGYGTLQEYLTFKKAGEKRKPDLVLLAFYLHNDVRNNSEHLNVSAKATRGGKRKRPFLDESNDAGWRILKPDYERMQKKFLKQKNSLSFRIRYNSVLLSMFRNARRAFKSRSNSFRGGRVLAMHACTGRTYFEKGWRTTERVFKKLKQDVEDIGARLVVFSVPALFDADLNIAKEFETSAGQNEPRFCIEDSPGYRQLRLMLKRNDIAYIDLVPDFREAVMKEGRDLFVRGDWHWNGEGHALAAGRVYEALKSRGHLPK